MRRSRNTWQKERVGEAINDFDKSFRVEDVYGKVKTEGIGIATVYRYLSDLREEKQINYFMCDGSALYSKNKIQHTHFHCSECDQSTHIQEVKLPLGKITGGKVESFQLDIRGICKNCLQVDSSK
jgi:Fe2+ or Zn2+ uptake regulation protein